MNYFFQISDNFMFEVYVRVSKHTGLGIIEVIRRKFTYEIRLLIMYYARKLREEQEEYERIKKKNDELKL